MSSFFVAFFWSSVFQISMVGAYYAYPEIFNDAYMRLGHGVMLLDEFLSAEITVSVGSLRYFFAGYFSFLIRKNAKSTDPVMSYLSLTQEEQHYALFRHNDMFTILRQRNIPVMSMEITGSSLSTKENMLTGYLHYLKAPRIERNQSWDLQYFVQFTEFVVQMGYQFPENFPIPTMARMLSTAFWLYKTSSAIDTLLLPGTLDLFLKNKDYILSWSKTNTVKTGDLDNIVKTLLNKKNTLDEMGLDLNDMNRSDALVKLVLTVVQT